MTDIYKLIIVGDENVGKTSLITRFTSGFYTEDYKTTIGVDFLFKEFHYKDKDIKLFIWDITGQERFRFLTNIYYNKVVGAIVVFDLHYKDSFTHCEDWLNNIYEKGINIKDRIVLVGNKSDKEAVVLFSEIDKLCKKHNIKYIETSVADNININEPFYYLLDKIYNSDLNMTKEKDNIVKLSFNKDIDQDIKNNKKCCTIS